MEKNQKLQEEMQKMVLDQPSSHNMSFDESCSEPSL